MALLAGSIAALALTLYGRWRSVGIRPLALSTAALAAYAIARSEALHVVVGKIGTEMPYLMPAAMPTVGRVSLQEILGWVLAGTLALEVSGALTAARRLRGGAQCLLAATFMGALAYLVECSATIQSWWDWRVGVGSVWFYRVPVIGIVDWFFVGTDVLVPLILWQRRAKGVAIAASLAAFPLHFACHAYVMPLRGLLPVSPMHLVHWMLLAVLMALCAWETPQARVAPLQPATVAGIAVIGVVAVGGSLSNDMGIVLSALPVIAYSLLFPAHPWLDVAATAWAIASLWIAPIALAPALPFAAAAAAGVVRRWGRRAVASLILATVVVAAAWEWRLAVNQEAVRRLVDEGIQMRDGGDPAAALERWQEASRIDPASHAPRALAGEVLLKTGRIVEAAREFDACLRAEADSLVCLQMGSYVAFLRDDGERALLLAERARRFYPENPEVQYLAIWYQGRLGAAASAILARRDLAADTLERLSDLAELAQDAAGRRDFLRRWAEQSPSDPAPALRLGLWYRDQGDMESARVWTERARRAGAK